ncbi:MAG: transcription termination/antitermination protein NusG [Gammaproteobacteria bacterium]
MNKWLVASYKINQLARVELNLNNQKIDYYLPKIIINDINVREELMFPGYVFINTHIKNYTVLKYTKGINKILKFGNNIPVMTGDDIKAIMTIEEESKNKPIPTGFAIGQEVTIKEGSFAGNLVNICSLPAGKRVDVLIYVLGSKRMVNISLDSISI